jgi:hypothetical protein
LCGVVVKPGVDMNWNKSIECRQPGCETRWVCSRAPDTVIYVTHMCCSTIFNVLASNRHQLSGFASLARHRGEHG